MITKLFLYNSFPLEFKNPSFNFLYTHSFFNSLKTYKVFHRVLSTFQIWGNIAVYKTQKFLALCKLCSHVLSSQIHSESISLCIY